MKGLRLFIPPFAPAQSGAAARTEDPPAGRDLVIRAEGLSDTNRFIQSVTLRGRDYPYCTLRHADLAAGGELILQMGPEPSAWGREFAP